MPSQHAISSRIHDRVAARLKFFEEALEAAQRSPTTETLNLLHEAADELMRATGRVVIEIEQLRSRHDA